MSTTKVTQTAYKQHKELLAKVTDELERIAQHAESATTPRTWELIEAAQEALERKKGSGRKPSGNVTAKEFAEATHGDGRGGYKLTIKIVPDALNRTVNATPLYNVAWDCPNCGHHNVQKWYGRAYHICGNCDQSTDLKGETE